MTKKIFTATLGFVALLGIQIAQANTTVTLSPAVPQPGDAVFATLSTNESITNPSFDGKPAYSYTYKNKTHIVFAVPFNQVPGTYTLKFTLANGQTEEEKVTIKKIAFKKIIIGIPEKLNLTPTKLKEKLATEKVSLGSIFATSSETIFFNKSFGMPLYKNVPSNFYGTTQITGDSQVHHFGVDLPAREGKPVAAMNNGVAVKVYTDTVYGNSIILDHGGHLFTMYLHLQKMNIKVGEKVTQGQIIGTVGQTGYATGPHLHLSVKVGDTSVDPLHFVRDFK